MKLDCDAVRDLLPEWAAGTLDEDSAAAVARHLKHCGACRAEADLVGLVGGATTSPPTDLHARVVAAVKARPAPEAGPRLVPQESQAPAGTAGPSGRASGSAGRGRGWWSLRPLALAASVLFILATGAGLWLGLRHTAAPSLAHSLAAVDALPVASGLAASLPPPPAGNGMVAGAATLDGLSDAQLRTLLSEMGS